MRLITVQIEEILRKMWPFLLISALILAATSCALRSVQMPDGQRVTVVEATAPITTAAGKKIESATGIDTAAVAGAAIDAFVKNPTIIQDAQSGSWMTISASILGFLSALFGGYVLRRKLKKK